MKIGDFLPADLTRFKQLYQAGTARQVADAAKGMLDPGQLLKGRVIEIDTTGMLTVETEFGSFKAASASELPVGREFLFQVVQGGNAPLLAEAGKANAVLNLLRVVLPGMSVLSGVGLDLTQEESVRAFWEGHAMDGTPDPVKLVKTMAQFSQSQPFDKNSMLPLIEGKGSTETIASQKMSQLIEAHSMINQAGGGHIDCDYAIFPIFFAEQAGKGEWLYSFDRREGGATGVEGGTSNLSFYLAMSRLGDVHIDLTTRPQLMSGVITLAGEEAAEHVRQHLQPLVQALEKVTESTVILTCRSGPVDCLKDLKDDLISRLGTNGHYALVDLKA